MYTYHPPQRYCRDFRLPFCPAVIHEMSKSLIEYNWLSCCEMLKFPMVQPWWCQFSNDSLSHVMKIAHRLSEVLMKPQFLEFLWLDRDFWEITGVRAENRKISM